MNKATSNTTLKMISGDDADYPLIVLPAGVAELVILGDADSDPFMTELALQRACRRFLRAHPGLVVRVAMAAVGCDFNDMLMEPA